MNLTLPTDSNERKEYPLYDGCLAYFPAALAGVAKHSKINNDKHNPGEPMHHSRGKSGDHANCILRHLVDLGDLRRRLDENSNYGQADWLGLAALDEAIALAVLDEANALAWRALALSQELHEMLGAPLAPAAKLPQEPVPLDAADMPASKVNC